MYPSDFPVEVPTPTLEPTLVAALVLVAVALAAAAFWLGQIHAARALARERAEACRRIHKHIAGKCKAAMSATRHEVVSKAGDLVDALEETLGPLLVVGGPTARRAGALTAALEGRRAAAGHDHDGHGHDDHGEPDGHGHGPDPDHPDDHAEAVTETSTRVRIGKAETVIVHGGPREGGGHGGHGGHGPKAPEPGLDPAAIRAAVGAFSDHWNDPDTLKTLIDLQEKLTAPKLPKEASSH